MASFYVDLFLITNSCSNWLGFLFTCHFSLSHLPCTVGLFFSSALVHLSLITLSLFPYLFLHPSFFSSSLFSSKHFSRSTFSLFFLLLFFLPSHPSICSCFSCLSPPPLQLPCHCSSHFFYTPPHLSLHPTLSGISLWRWI